MGTLQLGRTAIDGCLFCEKPEKGDDDKVLIVARSELSFAMLNRCPYNNGHLMVAPFRHVGKVEEVEDDESMDMQRLMAAVREGPEGSDAAGWVQHRHESRNRPGSLIDSTGT